MATNTTVPELTPFTSFTVTSASAGPFTIPSEWAFFDEASDLRVFNETLGTELTYAASPSDNTEFSVSGSSNSDGGFNGGTFTLGGTVENTVLNLQRDVPIARTEDFPTSTTTLNIAALNKALDKIATWAQQFKLIFNRSIRLADGDAEATLTIPNATNRASKLVGFDANGDVVVYTPNTDTYISASAFSLATFAASTAAAWRTALGLVIGTNVLAPNGSAASLTGMTLAGLADAAKEFSIPFTAGYASDMTGESVAVQTYMEFLVVVPFSVIDDDGDADTAPTGQAAILDIEKNGTTIYATKPQFAATATVLTGGTLKTDGTEDFAAGDKITFKVTQVGSSAAGQQFRFTLKARMT